MKPCIVAFLQLHLQSPGFWNVVRAFRWSSKPNTDFYMNVFLHSNINVLKYCNIVFCFLPYTGVLKFFVWSLCHTFTTFPSWAVFYLVYQNIWLAGQKMLPQACVHSLVIKICHRYATGSETEEEEGKESRSSVVYFSKTISCLKCLYYSLNFFPPKC